MRFNLHAEPAPVSIDLDRTALVIIDMQRDFLEPGGFGAALGTEAAATLAIEGPYEPPAPVSGVSVASLIGSACARTSAGLANAATPPASAMRRPIWILVM